MIPTSLRRLFSRISLRLMLFNALLVFVPVAGFLLLGTYERHLERAQIESMFRQGRLVVAMMQAGDAARPNIDAGDTRYRLIDRRGRVVFDSGSPQGAQLETGESAPRRNWLYRLGAAILKRPLRWLRPVLRPLTSSDAYERSAVLRGKEVQDAFQGRSSVEKRVSADPGRPVTLYTAVPIYQRGEVTSVVLVSRTTAAIRQDLHEIRLAILQIFALSVAAALILTLMVSTTIVRPLRQLRKEAGEILDRRGRLRKRFKGVQKRDEIGDLSRALERLTRRVEQHQQLTEAFASDVSHEFKNPLASIRTATEMLSTVESPEDRARFLRITEMEIARMENLLAQVREITRIDTEIQTEEREAVDVGALLRRIVDGFRLRERDRVQFDVAIPDAPLTVKASADRLIQVFENLLDNAVSFTPAGGRIAVSASGGDRAVLVTVRDQGPGIPPENLERIFDRFFTYRPAETQRQRHTGLGLSIVKAIVEGYGGVVTAANDPERGGAVFDVTLPT
jgi:two-component system, OmpR family, sensor histidine kinase ChvG